MEHNSKLSKTEESLMQYLWALGSASLKELVDAYTDPKPATTTIATLLGRIKKKGYLDFKREGKARIYFPLIAKEEYATSRLSRFVNDFFDDSPAQFASFFTRKGNLSQAELNKLRDIIESEIEKRKE